MQITDRVLIIFLASTVVLGAVLGAYRSDVETPPRYISEFVAIVAQ